MFNSRVNDEIRTRVFQPQLQGLDEHVGGLLRHLLARHRHLLLLLLRVALRRRQLGERRQPLLPQLGNGHSVLGTWPRLKTLIVKHQPHIVDN